MSDDEPLESRRVSPTPKSDLDLAMMTTDPAWGQPFIPRDLKDKLSEEYIESKTEINTQVILLENIPKAIEELISQGFKKVSENVYAYNSKYKDVNTTINPETGYIVSIVKDKVLSREGYWEILGYYTRDLRLGNLADGSNPFRQDEVAFCEYHLNLAGDELNFYHKELPHGFHKAFFAHIRRVASKIEISHSKNGWYRKQSGTITSNVEYKGVPPDANAKKYFGSIGGRGGKSDG